MFTKYIENFLSDDECNHIISLGEDIDLNRMKGARVKNGKVIETNIIYEDNKRSGGYFKNKLLEIPIIKNISNEIVKLSNELKPFKGIIYNGIEKYSFNKYKTDDFLNWHSDLYEISAGATLTYIIQLNDDYKDGYVKYKINNIEYKVNKKKGSLFVFDSNILHSVEKITNGTRYSINAWPSKIIKKSII
jgi:Rps23 Pro-64 3,4-dihydroxylase Tpa1-like proline 4-hydroxylase